MHYNKSKTSFDNCMRLQNTLNIIEITDGEQIEQTLAIDYRSYRVE